MRRRLFSILAFAMVTCVGAALVNASEPAGQGQIRVLLTYGGHGFEEKSFFALFDGLSDVQYTKAELPKSAGLFKPGLEKTYDVIVMYDMVGGFTPEQQKAFVDLLQKGIGVVSLHHNMGAHRNWDEFRNIIGGKFILEECTIDGKAFKKSTWDHDQEMKITVADANHPITRGIQDFQIHDETYGGYYTSPSVHVLLKTDHPKNSPDLAWVTHYGNSKVFYLMLGHDGKAYANPSYVKLVHQGIRWAAGR